MSSPLTVRTRTEVALLVYLKYVVGDVAVMRVMRVAKSKGVYYARFDIFITAACSRPARASSSRLHRRLWLCTAWRAPNATKDSPIIIRASPLHQVPTPMSAWGSASGHLPSLRTS